MRALLLLVIITAGCSAGVYAQGDSMRLKMQQMAEKGGYGILYAQVGTTGVSQASSGFKGFYEINLKSKNLDTVSNSPILQDEAAQKSLMDLSQLLVKKGVDFRNNGANRDAILCYRLPLYMVCKRNEKTGIDIISRNLWTAKEEMKQEVTSAEIKTIDGLLKTDGEYLLGKYSKEYENTVFDPSGASFEIFLLYHRLADFAHNEVLRKRILSWKLAVPGSMEESRLLTAIMEELAATSLEDLLIEDKPDNTFKQTWSAFLKYRYSVPEKNVVFFRNLFNYSLRWFDMLQIAAVSAGGPFGHNLSYNISGYIQEIGRDIVYFDMINGKPLDGLLMSENIRAKSLTSWLARNHGNRLFTYKPLWGLSNFNVSKPWQRPVVLDDIYDAAKNSGSPVLTYLKIRGLYMAWLITPEGKVFYGACRNADSMCNVLYKKLPYNFQEPDKTGKINPVSRGLSIEYEGKTGGPEGTAGNIFRELYNELVPSNIRGEINSDRSGKLVIVTDGTLNYVPFAALMGENGRYLAEDKEIVYWPSIQSAMILNDAADIFKYEQASADKAGEAEVKIFGDPVFSGNYSTTVNGKARQVNLAPLPGTAIEAVNIGKLFNVKPLLKNDAKVSEFTGKMKYSILHLATHGYLNAEEPRKSFIALTDGPLYAEDLYNEKFIVKAKMVVLSACQTGLGSFTDDSPIGLNSAFLVGGANCTVSSLWSIDDEATSQLMMTFYKNIKDGSAISKSLRDAQLWLMSQPKWKSPLYWAAFKTMGIATNPLSK